MTNFSDPVHHAAPVTFGIGCLPSLPTGIVANVQIAALAAIDATKLVARLRRGYAQESATTSVSEARVIHVANGAGTLIGFVAGLVVTNVGAATVTVNLKKNGVSVLTSVITLNSSSVAYIDQAATFSSNTYVDGDVFEVTIIATAGGGTLAKGVFANLVVDELAA